MNKLMQQFSLASLAALVCVWMTMSANAQSAPNVGKAPADVSITYSALHMNSPVNGCGCFWMSGGTAEVAVPLWRYVSVVGELSGETAGTIPGSRSTGISLISGMGGVRLNHDVHRIYRPFAQGVLGGVHAFNSYFPAATSETSASSFSSAVGGGLDISVRKNILIRPIQVEYEYMELPNNSSNQQHDLRLSVGAVYRFAR